MSILTRSETSPTSVFYDYCIVGSGPAGLTLCNELSKTGKRICVIESGGKKLNEQHTDLKKVLSVGEIKIKESSRERVLGGTSHTWAGLSSPLDPIDFDRWPISFLDLEKYYKKLTEYGFAKIEDFNLSTFDAIKQKSDYIFPLQRLEEKIFIAADPPLNFGKKFEHLFTQKHIDLYINSTVVEIISESLDHTIKKITSVYITDPQGHRSYVRAKTFVLCAGGLESTRLLLISKIGNEHNQVGKYLMNHPKNNFGILELRRPVKRLPYLLGYLHEGFAKYAGLRLPSETQKQLGILNSYIRMEPMFPWTDSKGVYALITVTKRAKTILAWWKRKQKNITQLKDWNETGDDAEEPGTKKQGLGLFRAFWLILFDIKPVFLYGINRIQSKREIFIRKIRIRNFMEMEPSPHNTLTLSNELDRYGNPLPVVTVTTTELDRKSLRVLHATFRDEVKNFNLGTFTSDLDTASPWPITTEASHHLGGTIMGTDITKSVVDANLKVHSTDNLYICSGSVFPSSGSVNPTYTICALAARLSEHLIAQKTF